MPVPVQCPACGKRFQARDELAGRTVACPCGQKLTVPASDSNPMSGLGGVTPPLAGTSFPLGGPGQFSMPEGMPLGSGFGAPVAKSRRSTSGLAIALVAVGTAAAMALVVVGVLVLPRLFDVEDGDAQAAAAQPAAAQAAAPGQPAGAEVVELSDAVVTVERGANIDYRVNYRFTSGGPQADKWYLLDVAFEGTSGSGAKMMRGSELAAEGTVEGGFRVFGSGATAYTMKMQMGPSQGVFTSTVSNTLSGPIQKKAIDAPPPTIAAGSILRIFATMDKADPNRLNSVVYGFATSWPGQARALVVATRSSFEQHMLPSSRMNAEQLAAGLVGGTSVVEAQDFRDPLAAFQIAATAPLLGAWVDNSAVSPTASDFREELVAFWASDGAAVSPLPLAEAPPAENEIVWAVSEVVVDGESTWQLVPAAVYFVKDNVVLYEFHDATHSHAARGMPVLNSAGAVVAVHQGAGTHLKNLIQVANPIANLRAFLQKRLGP